jgi:hypothetical protein
VLIRPTGKRWVWKKGKAFGSEEGKAIRSGLFGITNWGDTVEQRFSALHWNADTNTAKAEREHVMKK